MGLKGGLMVRPKDGLMGEPKDGLWASLIMDLWAGLKAYRSGQLVKLDLT